MQFNWTTVIISDSGEPSRKEDVEDKFARTNSNEISSTGQVPWNCTNQSFFNLKYLKKQTSECNKKEEDSQMERTSECFPVGRGKQEEQYRVGD